MKIKRFFIFAISTFLLTTFVGCSIGKERYEKEYVELFDTYIKIIIYADSSDEFDNYSNCFYDSMSRYNKLFDIYNSYDNINNIKTINDNAGIKPVAVEKELIEFLKYAKDTYKISNSKINFAFGSVLQIWHNYRETALDFPESASVPTMEELKKADEHTDINSIEINEKDNTVYISDKKTSIDVGALAKGYAVQKTADLLKEKGVTSALLNAGGNICTIGTPPDSDSWNVGIQDPDDTTKIYDKISVSDKSVVTSGNYQRYYTVNGKIYHHIIDPETLMPADLYKNVTVITGDSQIADMLSTALFILPYDDGKKLAQQYNADVLWIFTDGHAEKTF